MQVCTLYVTATWTETTLATIFDKYKLSVGYFTKLTQISLSISKKKFELVESILKPTSLA